MVCEVKAVCCQLPVDLGMPLSRLSRADIQRYVLASGICAQISGATIWRWLHEDAIRPWFRRYWHFPRDPAFAEKGGRVLDLYHRLWEGVPLEVDEFVLSADEKTQIQLRERLHRSQPPGPRRAQRVEQHYRRHGTCAYQAAWDVHRARLFGHVVDSSTIVNFDALVAQVMQTELYRSAKRVFWIVDNGGIHRGEASCQRLTQQWPNLVLVHLPTHASWLNQIEIYFSILQRKALTPDDFADPHTLAQRILDFQDQYEQLAEPFQWCFTRDDLQRLLQRWADRERQQAA